MGRGLIVGIDPGTTSAVAVLDLKGNLLGLKSKKGFPQNEIQSYVQGFGQPLLFSVDVVKVPTTVEKIAAAFNLRVEAPQKDLGRREKSALVSTFLNKFNKTTEDFHGVSALAAAIVCYNKHENKFRQIERQLKEQGILDRVEEIKRKVIQGISVDRALEGRP